MSNELDTRARQAAADLKAAMAEAELTSVPPGAPVPRGLLVAALRPAWVIALLLVGSTVGVAMMLDSSPAPTTIPPTTVPVVVTTTVTIPPATFGIEPSPPTTPAVAAPLPPVTTMVAADTEPPLLEVTSPEEGAEMEEKTITFAGITEPGARVFAGKYEADVDAEGNWHIVLILSEGANRAKFVARDAAGNESEASVTVYYVAPTTTTTEPTTTTTEKKPAEFSASATFGSCSETPPYDVYHGTGEPGSLVTVSSEFGSGSVEVGAEGQWEKKVFFETAPPGEPFVVRVSDEYGRAKEFEFVYQP